MKISDRFKTLGAKEKLLAFASVLLAVAVVVFALLQIFEVVSWAECVYLPLMSLSLFLQAYSERRSKKVFVISLVTAAIVLVCSVGVIIINLVG